MIDDNLYVMPARKSGDIFEVVLTADSSNVGSHEILRELLGSIGIGQSNVIERKEWPNSCLAAYYSSRAKARAIQKKLRSYHLKDVAVTINKLRPKDWQAKWKERFQPFFLTNSFGIIPLPLKGKHRFRKHVPIYIDSDLAFGTGLHATTRFMSQFVERCQGRFDSFLDIGTGTGILSIIASKCHATDVTAFDISPQAVKVAKSNFAENNCQTISVKVADAQKFKTTKRYDLVCANLITYDLVQLAKKVIRLVKPGKYLAVSGISLNSYNAFRREFAPYPLKCIKIEKGEGWIAILFKKLI